MTVSDKVVVGASGFGLFGWATNKLYGRITDEAYNKYAKVYEPTGIVSIVIPAFNEENYIKKTLKSILSQNIIRKYPDYFECIVVDNESTDSTATIAKQYCQVISAPKGKLNARHAGIKHAVGSIIVSCDADCYYPPNWLNILIRHFHKPEVIAVIGSILTEGSLLHKIGFIWYNSLSPFAGNRISGGNAAFLKEYYFKVGGFDLSIDQLSREEIQMEEEIVFSGKLRHFGKVVFEIKACCFAAVRDHFFTGERSIKSKYLQEIKEGKRF